MSEPRVFPEGSPLPADVFKVRDSMGDVWERNAISDVDLWFTPETVPMTWARIAKKYAPLTEVLPAVPAAVSPNAPTPEEAEDDCAHCSPTHERPESRPWGVYVAPQRDGDGQPTHLVVQPSNGAHVAQSDADWLWQLIRDVPVGVSGEISVSAGKDTEEGGENGRGELSGAKVSLLKLIQDGNPHHRLTETESVALAEAILANGWQAPPCNCLPFDVCERCYGPEQQRESQARQLAYCEEMVPVADPEDADQCPNLRERGSTFCAQHQPAPVVAETPADTVREFRSTPTTAPAASSRSSRSATSTTGICRCVFNAYRKPICNASEGCTGIDCGLVAGHDSDHEGTHTPRTDGTPDSVGYLLFVRWPYTTYDHKSGIRPARANTEETP